MSEITNASVQLELLKDRILRLWESKTRENVTSAPSKSTFVLRDQLPELLENLISNLSPTSERADLNRAGRIGSEHGEQRAALTDYTFSQVLLEYRILRQVIFEVLEEEKIQGADVRNTILDVLDTGIEKAIDRFSVVRSEELKRSNRDLEHFAAIAAHDLKSPLATISGFAELLDESLQGKIGIEETKFIKTIRRASARMTLLIDRLLEYSSVGREMKPFEAVSTTQIVEGVIESLKRVIESSHAKIHYERLPLILGDASLLSQFFQNFIGNALKYRHPRRIPEIFIDAKEEEKNWLFSIRDNGVGFDPKDEGNIFSLFKRLEVTKDQGGSGIGLATARKVVELHGGKVWADSQPGLGSTFFFTLPKLLDDVGSSF